MVYANSAAGRASVDWRAGPRLTTLERALGCAQRGTNVGEPVSESEERRRFMRVKAPVCYRPAKRRLARRQVIDLGLGGMRVYSDEAFRIGTRFEVDLFLPDDSSITCLTEVVWIHPIDGGRPANFDVGLRFLDIPPGDRERLGQVLEGE
jgi:hypothetical protein